jgi:hypothetical protein
LVGSGSRGRVPPINAETAQAAELIVSGLEALSANGSEVIVQQLAPTHRVGMREAHP